MKTFVCLLCIAASCALIQPSGARADFADPRTSYEDPCLVTCPAGESTFMMVLRATAGYPWPYDDVVLDFCGCPRVSLVPGMHSYQIQPSGCQIRQYPTPDGEVLLSIAAGGACGDSVLVNVAGIFFPSRAVASFDQDGDLAVTGADLQLIQAKLFTSDATADFNCDGMVTDADVAIAQTHLGHGVPTAVPDPQGVAGGFRFSHPPAPNPMNGETSFAIVVPGGERLEVFVTDLAGRRVTSLWGGVLPAGERRFTWRTDASSRPRVAPGVYVVVARTARLTLSRLVTLLR